MIDENSRMERRFATHDRREIPRESGEVRRKSDEIGVEPEKCDTCHGYLYKINGSFQCARPDQHK